MTTTWNQIHWRAPAVMLSGFFAALGIAIGHHFFYAGLQDTEVPSQDMLILGIDTTQQQINLSVGTLLAFLFKAAITIAVTTAYMQIFFRAVLSNTQCEMGKLNNLFSGTKDLVSFVQGITCYHYWLLSLVGLAIWLLPLAAVFSTAALTIISGRLPPRLPVLMASVQPAFASLAFTTVILGGMNDWDMIVALGLPSSEVFRIVNAAASAGSILPMQSPGTNATWETTMLSPHLSCNYFNDDGGFLAELKENIHAQLNFLSQNGTSLASIIKALGMPSYLAWANTSEVLLPFVHNTPNVSGGATDLQGTTIGGIENTTRDLYIAVFPAVFNLNTWRDLLRDTDPDIYTSSDPNLPPKTLDKYFESIEAVRCQLEAATYSLRLTFNGTDQSQHVEILSTQLQRIPRELLATVKFEGHNSTRNVYYGDFKTTTENDGYSLRVASFQAIWASFQSIIVGQMDNLYDPEGVGVSGYQAKQRTFPTRVLSTPLARTKELFNLTVPLAEYDRHREGMNYSDAPHRQLASMYAEADFEPTISRMSLKDCLEELFFNISISMASSPLLIYNPTHQANYTNPFTPLDIEVTFDLWGNIYQYTPRKLWLPYGVALAVAFLNVSIGLWAMLSLGAAYTADFSTIFRIAKNAYVQANTQELQLPGKDPLPKSLARAGLEIKRVDSSPLKDMSYVRVKQVEEERDGDSI